MDKAQVEQPIQEDNAESAQEPTTPEVEEKTGVEMLLDKIEMLEARIVQLENGVQNHSHTIDGSVVQQIALLAVQHINNGIRQRMKAV
jgi:hypothetical protein